MTLPVTVTRIDVIYMAMNPRQLSKFNAMRKRITEIVILQERPFSFLDLKSFEMNDKHYELKYGTIRNYLSKLTKVGEIEFSYNSGIAFYTLPGKKFSKDVTADHVGGHSSFSSLLHQLPVKNSPIYKWLKNRRIDKQALHDIRLTFEANGIWALFYKGHPNLVDNDNQDLHLPSLAFFEYLDVGITVQSFEQIDFRVV